MNSVDMLNKLWAEMNRSQKEHLLEARGLNKSWAETKTVKEMVQRGGGFAARDLLDLTNIWKKKNPDTMVKFKDGSAHDPLGIGDFFRP